MRTSYFYWICFDSGINPDPSPHLSNVNMAASGKATEVELGFVETIAGWRLSSPFFPSKIGGKPAWLTLKPIPSADNVKCGKCNEPCVFLLQVYASIPNENTCFHRTLFVFICKNPACCTRRDNSNFVVLRSQLPKLNEFYSDIPPDENCEQKNLTGAERYQDLCGVCGCAGPKRCGKCHTASYCSREHQRHDWKQRHKTVCGELNTSVSLAVMHPSYSPIKIQGMLIQNNNNFVSLIRQLSDCAFTYPCSKLGTISEPVGTCHTGS